MAQAALQEAADAPLARIRKGFSLRAWGMKIAKHRGTARVAVARKLAAIPHPMWRDGADFRFGAGFAAAAP